jgi:DNA-binding CsgD family transcriptional regulator
MSANDDLRGLVDGAYAAALDDTLWPAWTDELVGLLGGSFGTFFAVEASTGVINHLVHVRSSIGMEEEYVAFRMGELDPQIPYVRSLPRSGFFLDTEHVDLTNPKTAEFTRWMMCNVGMQHHMTTVARLDGGRIRAGVSIHRAVADGATPIEEQEKLVSILPDITRAMELGFVHNKKLAESYWSGLTQACGEPALLLDERGRVIRATDDLIALLTVGDGLDIAGGFLRASTPADHARLQAVLGRAIARHGASAGAARVTRPSGKAPYVLTAFPLPNRARHLAPAEAAVLVTVVDPAAANERTAGLWSEAFGLSAREAQLATLLMAGHSLESAAAVQGITLHTARMHARRLFSKTGTARQSDLVRLLGRVGRV